MSMIIEPLSGYPLGENLSSFEAYLFITREGLIRLHHHIPDYNFNILIRNSIPHIHFLCQRKDGDSNVLQKYIIDKIRKRV